MLLRECKLWLVHMLSFICFIYSVHTVSNYIPAVIVDSKFGDF